MKKRYFIIGAILLVICIIIGLAAWLVPPHLRATARENILSLPIEKYPLSFESANEKGELFFSRNNLRVYYLVETATTYEMYVDYLIDPSLLFEEGSEAEAKYEETHVPYFSANKGSFAVMEGERIVAYTEPITKEVFKNHCTGYYLDLIEATSSTQEFVFALIAKLLPETEFADSYKNSDGTVTYVGSVKTELLLEDEDFLYFLDLHTKSAQYDYTLAKLTEISDRDLTFKITSDKDGSIVYPAISLSLDDVTVFEINLCGNMR